MKKYLLLLSFFCWSKTLHKRNKTMGVLNILLILTIAQILIGELVRINLGNGIILKPLDISVVLITFAWLVTNKDRYQAINKDPLFLPIVLFSSVAAFSLIINSAFFKQEELISSSLYLIRWIGFMGIYFVVKDFKPSFKKNIVNMQLVVGLIFVLLGYVQYFFYQTLGNLFYAGWDEHLYRMFSTFLDPNFAGILFVLFFILQLGSILKKSLKNPQSMVQKAMLILTFVAIFLTFSRSAIIMLIVSSTVFLFIANRKKLILFLLGSLLIMFVIASDYFNIENVNPFRIVSTAARVETSKNALEIIIKNPILGVGFNTYRFTQVRYGLRNSINAKDSHADAAPDNSYLFVLATTGIVGFAAYTFLFYRIFLRYRKNAVVIASLVGLLVSGLFLNSLFYPPVMLWMWVLLGTTD